ncbi:MAG: HypC/HybG/HupF family hydrogenase formation chaperone [Acidobacteriota bacterium]
MCLGIPMKVVKIEENLGIVETGGVKRRIFLDLIDDVKEGDYVIVHAGYAIHRIDEKEAQENLDLIRQYLSATELS